MRWSKILLYLCPSFPPLCTFFCIFGLNPPPLLIRRPEVPRAVRFRFRPLSRYLSFSFPPVQKSPYVRWCPTPLPPVTSFQICVLCFTVCSLFSSAGGGGVFFFFFFFFCDFFLTHSLRYHNHFLVGKVFFLNMPLFPRPRPWTVPLVVRPFLAVGDTETLFPNFPLGPGSVPFFPPPRLCDVRPDAVFSFLCHSWYSWYPSKF